MRSLVWSTDVDVLPADRVVHRRDGYTVIRSPGNPTHYWGNLLVFDEPPVPGDLPRWEARFAAEFAEQPQSRHRTLAWDRTDDALGTALGEFAAAGYALERQVGLIATPEEIRPHPRANREVAIRSPSPHRGVDEDLWEQVLELQAASRDPGIAEQPHREFSRRRMAELRELFAAGHGAWYVALLEGEVVGSCGVVVCGDRARFQSVDTAAAHRRRGVCSRLVVEAAHAAAARHGARRLVIAADAGYHALGIYESLGFVARERVNGVCLPPAEDRV